MRLRYGIGADGVKVRLQTQSHDGPRRNMGQMFVHIVKEHGAQGLYKGVSNTIFQWLRSRLEGRRR